jgi:Uma2 family endonuclease
LLNRLLPEEAIVRVQSPIRLDDELEPQPDVALLKPRDYTQDRQHPGPDAVLLVIEVSDTTLSQHRTAKAPLYGRAGILEVWIINLQQESIEVYSQPERGAYQKPRRAQRGQSIAVPGFGDVSLRVDDVLG